MRAHLPQDELAKQTLYGAPVFNSREVSHMADVRSVFQFVLVTGQIVFILLVLIGFLLWSRQQALASALQFGGLLTCGLILLIGMTAIAAWQSWFSTFHLLFFKPGSWLFLYTDALIRLFPEKFWFDSALTISGLVLVRGLLATIFGWRWKINFQRSAYPA